MVNDLLSDGFGHHLWATRELFAFCRPLSDEQRAATVDGTYGGIHATLQHLVETDAWYLFLLTGDRPSWANFDEDVPQPFVEVEGWAGEVADSWERLLSEPSDPEREIVQPMRSGDVARFPAGIVLSQTLVHGAEHRSQVATILTTLGIEPPDLDVWAFALATGRETRSPA